MHKPLALLLLAVLLPGAVLGWLALRSAEEQAIILERRTTELFQRETDAAAALARLAIDEQRRAFTEIVNRLAAERDPHTLANEFTAELAKAWQWRAVGFALSGEGRLLCPTARDARDRAECQQFLWDNGAFLGNKVVATVYPVSVEELNKGDTARLAQSRSVATQTQMQQQPAMIKKLAPPAEKSERKSESSSEGGVLVMRDAPADAKAAAAARNVTPQQTTDTPGALPLASAIKGFRQLTVGAEEGIVNRFVQDRLNMIFWVRPARAPELVFGCLFQADELRPLLAFPETDASSADSPQTLLAILDDKGRPVRSEPADAPPRDWKRPFVASEIGEALPHWEAALYLHDPAQLNRAAQRTRATLLLLIGTALAAIALGGWMMLADTRRQLALAQKKTDFVSNVSHELKTPLTSIRMFAELMSRGGVAPEKQEQYLRIIGVEAERLTRLINNVLDFARLDRRQKPLETHPLDAHAVIARVWENHELHLRESGFATSWEEDAPPPYPITGDADALAQVLVNLLSNAEKYSAEHKEVTLRTVIRNGVLHVSVLDRGTGVRPGEETRIFKPFHRAHDSLTSAIPGTGLGLTLAQRIAREHGGEILFERRESGGSVFTLQLPICSTAS